jgi:hypothetical protein
MATQSHIMLAEDDIIHATNRIQETIDSFNYEVQINEGAPYKANHDLWGTLSMNLHALIIKAQKLQKLLTADYSKVQT